MSGFSSIAKPGGVPTCGPGRGSITPDSLFGSSRERADYQRILDRRDASRPGIKVKKVRVEIFDLSDKKQIKAYEKLWAELLEKTARMEVVVESSKDLVRRADGTSYWMKYVEYVEFEEADAMSVGPQHGKD